MKNNQTNFNDVLLTIVSMPVFYLVLAMLVYLVGIGVVTYLDNISKCIK